MHAPAIPRWTRHLLVIVFTILQIVYALKQSVTMRFAEQQYQE